MNADEKREIAELKERLMRACIKFETLVQSDVFMRDAKAIEDVRKTVSALRANLADMIDLRSKSAVKSQAIACDIRFKSIEDQLAVQASGRIDYKMLIAKTAAMAAVTTLVSLLFCAVIVFIDNTFDFGIVKFVVKFL